MEKQLEDLLKKYEKRGFYWGADLLLEPEVGLEMLKEFESLNIDRGFTGVHVYSPHPSGGYVEGGGYLTMDAVPRDDNFVTETIHQAKIFLSERLDPHETHIALKFEKDGHRNRRMNNPPAE